MKKLLSYFIIILSLSNKSIGQQSPITYFQLSSISSMKTYNGIANMIYVANTNESYILCSNCIVNDTTVYSGVGIRKWKKATANIDISNKVDKVIGKSLSDRNYTNADSLKLQSIDSGAKASYIVSTIAGLRAMSTKPGVIYHSTDNIGGDWDDIGLFDNQVVDDGAIYIITANNRILKRRYSGKIDIRWFGAKCDGTDDAAAVRAAMNYAYSINKQFLTIASYLDTRGASIYMPAGTTVIKSSIEWKDGVTIEGDGRSASFIIFDLDSTKDGFYNIPPSGSGYSRITARNISFIANDPRKTRDLVHLTQARVFFDNVACQFAGRYGMYLNVPISSQFSKCDFGNCGSHNFYLGSTGGVGTSTTYSQCYFSNSLKGSGVFIEDCLNASFSNTCVFESNGYGLTYTNGYASDSTAGWGIVALKGKVYIYSAYAEDNHAGLFWLGKTRDPFHSTNTGNHFTVKDFTNANTSFGQNIRIDEADVVDISSDNTTNTSNLGLYNFYARGGIQWKIEIPQDEVASQVRFHDPVADTLIPISKVEYAEVNFRYNGGATIKNKYLGAYTNINTYSLTATNNISTPYVINTSNRMYFGGKAAANAMIVASGNSLSFQFADGSQYAPITSAGVTANGNFSSTGTGSITGKTIIGSPLGGSEFFSVGGTGSIVGFYDNSISNSAYRALKFQATNQNEWSLGVSNALAGQVNPQIRINGANNTIALKGTGGTKHVLKQTTADGVLTSGIIDASYVDTSSATLALATILQLQHRIDSAYAASKFTIVNAVDAGDSLATFGTNSMSLKRVSVVGNDVAQNTTATKITYTINTVKRGIAYFSGDGVKTSFDVTLSVTPSWVGAEEGSDCGSNIRYRSPISNGIRVFFPSPPPAGTNNITILYSYY